MNPPGTTNEKGLIAWFASNHVAANLLMLIIIVAGIASAITIRKQTLPDFELNNVTVTVPYLGAAPQEVEEGVVIKIEEAVQDIDGIEDIRSVSSEGIGRVTIEVEVDADLDEVLNEVKTRVDAISTFPALSEQPVITKQEVPQQVLFVALYGDIDELTRKLLGQEIRDELIELPEVADVQFLGDRAFEISVEVSEQTLREYDLTMSEISQAIRDASVDLPGGSINTDGGDILLRTIGQAYTGADFGELVLRTYPDGTRLLLADVADIKDGFVEDDTLALFNGQPTASLQIMTDKRQNEMITSRAVREYVDARTETLPAGVKLTAWADRSPYLKDRLTMMLKNMFFGALLVFLMLSLFLRSKVAGWVIVGIPVTFLGALWLMPLTPWEVSINMISLFGFIMVLGIVVDDAIIIGESVYTQVRKDGHSLDAVIRGAKRVAVPATFGVLTTIAAFTPMLFLGGAAGPFFEAMSVVVTICLLFSLIESKLILPSHLAHTKIPEVDEEDLFRPQRRISPGERIPRFFLKINRHVQHGLAWVIREVYRPALAKAVRNKGIVVASFVGVLIMTLGLIAGGKVRVVLFPDVAGEFIQTNVSVRDGTPTDVRNAVFRRIEGVATDLRDAYGEANPGEPPYFESIGTYGSGETDAIIFVQLPKDVDRDFDATDVIREWREGIGEIPEVKDLKFTFGFPLGGGSPISLQLSGDNPNTLESAADALESRLAEYAGVFDILNSSASGAQEIKLDIKPEAQAAGLTMAMLGRQVRQAFYGEEAQRIQRGKNEVKVMVRYPESERRSIADLENMMIRTPSGEEVPFDTVATVEYGSSYSSINRLNRKRVVTIEADVDPSITEPQTVVQDIVDNHLPEILARHPGVRFSLSGSSQEERDFVANLGVASLVALFMIYALIAVPLKSYAQPIIIMSVIPFGLIGAVIGHIVLGKAISMFSMLGLVALAGVVVNDSLIMVDFVNRARLAGMSAVEAVIESGAQRFRAIILTSITTAAGLLPIIFETSAQAQFIIPMAISVSFGILFATVITLFLIPCLYLMQLGFLDLWSRFWNFLMGRTHYRDSPEHA